MKKNRIIEFYAGQRNCGKSVYVENKLLVFDELLYVATLPPFDKYKYTIRKHRERRGNKWHTIELAFDFYRDISAIASFVQTMDEKGACMLDGIWTWYCFQNKLGDKINPVDFAESIIEIINTSKTNWFLVDVIYYHRFPELYTIHKIIIEKIDIIKVINKNKYN